MVSSGEVAAETGGWLQIGGLIKQVNTLGTMGARFLTIRKGITNTEREKTRMNPEMLDQN